MHSIIIILIAVFVMISIIKKVRDAHEKRPGEHDAPSRAGNAPNPSSSSFSERVRRNPTDSAAWAEWGFSLLQEALGAGKDPKSRVALIEAANSKLATAHGLNLQDYDVPHEWAVALGYACAGCDLENREKYLAKAMELARKSFEKIDPKDIYYYYDWAEMLTTIAPLFPEAKQRRILGEAYIALGKADKLEIDDGDYYNLWIETCIKYALLFPGDQRIALLEEAYSLYKKVPEDEEEFLSAGLEKRIQAELEKARSLRGEPAGTEAEAPVIQSHGDALSHEEAMVILNSTLPSRPESEESTLPAPGNDEANFALLVQQYTPQFSTDTQTAAVSSATAPPFTDSSAAVSEQTAARPPESPFTNYKAPDLSGSPFADSAFSFTGTPVPEAPSWSADRELPEYARPAEQQEKKEAPSTPSGYKPINYKR